jgi:hypothetical protein
MSRFRVDKGKFFAEKFWNPLYQKVMSKKCSKDEYILLKKISKAIAFLEINPFHNSLNSHDIKTLSNRYKKANIVIFESYIENNNPKAGRIFWYYSLDERGVIIIVGFSDHPENTKFGYDSLKFPDLKQYENKTKETQMKRKINENNSNKEFQELFQMFREYWENDSNRSFQNEFFRSSELEKYLNKVCKFDFSDDEISDILSNWERNKLVSRFDSEIWRFEDSSISSIDINKEQVINITDEMKRKYFSLKDFNEILILGKRKDWWSATRYAYNNNAYLPNRDELKDIWKIIDLDDLKYHWAWTREVVNMGSAYSVSSYGLIDRSDNGSVYNVFCVR